MAPSESCTLTFLQHAIAMNNKAIGLMALHQNSQGIDCFQTALRVLKEAFAANISQQETHSSLVLAHSNQILRPCIASSFPAKQEDGYVYNHYFVLDETSIRTDNEALVVLCSATVLFNYGLALHKHGLLRRSDSSINKALFVYDLVYDLMMPCAMDVACEACAALITVVLNNQAQICMVLCEFKNAQSRLQNVGRILQSKYLHLCNMLSAMVVDELHLNCLVSHIPYASHAA